MNAKRTDFKALCYDSFGTLSSEYSDVKEAMLCRDFIFGTTVAESSILCICVADDGGELFAVG